MTTSTSDGSSLRTGSTGPTSPRSSYGRTASRRRTSAPPPVADAQLADAIARAQEALLARQLKSGAWEVPVDLGPTALATQLIVERHLGVLTPQDAREGERALLAQQRPDGSFLPYPHAPAGTVCATAVGYAALLACGASRRAPACERAWRFVEQHGGRHAIVEAFRTGDMSAVYLLLAGVLEPDFLPRLPLELVLAPLERLTGTRVHAGNVMVLMTLLALGAQQRPARRGLLAGALRTLERLRVESCLGEYQNPSGSWNQITLQTLLMVVGLSAIGLSARDGRVARALAWLETRKRRGPEGLSIDAIPNDVWSTAMAVLALVESGVDPEHEAVRAGVDFLCATQSTTPQPLHNQRKRDAVRVGGWSFQQGNPTMPDCDDTGFVLATLATCAGDRGPRDLYRAIDRALAWLRDMQNPDGGWPCYVWNLPGKPPGPLFLEPPRLPLDDPRAAVAFLFDPPPELSDPSSEGITGRVLWGLGAAGIGRREPSVARAIEFLRHQQCESGAWWGRWKTCYLPETGTILAGLAAVGEDMEAPYVRRAVRFVESRQNEDGGFGETPEAYRDPALAGVGPSMPPVTGFVTTGLIAARASRPVIDRAVGYLVRAQRGDGGWPNQGWLETFIPPDLFYEYPFPADTLPLVALGRYRRLVRSGRP